MKCDDMIIIVVNKIQLSVLSVIPLPTEMVKALVSLIALDLHVVGMATADAQTGQI